MIFAAAVLRVVTGAAAHGRDFDEATTMRTHSRSLPLKPLALALGLGLAASGTQAALRIEVTSAGDAGGENDCTLRQAIVAINAGDAAGSGCVAAEASGADVVVFDTTLFPPGGTNMITLADEPFNTLDVLRLHVAIDATANGNVTVQRARPSSDDTNAFGILRQSVPTGSLTLKNLTIRNGRVNVPNLGGNYAAGGGVACACAHLSVVDSTISDNSVAANAGLGGAATGYGGGVYVYGGTLDVTRSVISGNVANAAGGGIAVYRGDVNLDHATVVGNRVENGTGSARGGGVYTRPGDLSATDSLISANVAQRYGGGLFVSGGLTLAGSTVDGNTAAGDGGGMKLLGGGTLTNSTVSGNTAYRGGGIYDAAGYHVAMHPLTLVGSTVSGNRAIGPSQAKGGGLFSRYGGLYLTNSTVAANTSDLYGGGLYVMKNTAPIVLSQVTVAANGAAQRGGGMMVATSDAGSVTSNASVFANTAGAKGGGENIAVTTGGITVAGDANLVFAAGLMNVAFSNAPATGDPLLGALGDHGGPTRTMVPGAGSAAIDGYATSGGQCAAATDQRGIARPQGAGCDIGAVERVSDRIFADGFEAPD